MAGECIHGFAPGTCLICQALGQPTTATHKAATHKNATHKTDKPARSRRALETQSGPRVVPKEAPRTSSPAIKVAGLAIGVVAVIVLAWTALHLVFAVLHIVELIGVAIIAGYLGWVAGVFHGRRTARRG